MSTMLASDANNPNFAGATNPDAALAVRFYKRAIQDIFQTTKQGRPIFQDVDYIEIFTPGNQLNIIDTPVREHHKVRFPVQWAHYRNQHGGDQRETGTPVNQWPFLSMSQAEELKAIKFFTVEMIANASDLQINSIGMIGGMAPNVLRERANAYLNAAAGTASVEAEATEKAQLKEQLKALQDQVALMMQQNSNPVLVAAAKDLALVSAVTNRESIKEAKAKRVLSPEHLAKLAAGRAAKKEQKETPSEGN